MTRFNQLSDQYFDPLTSGFLIDGFIKFEVSGGGADKDTFADIDQTIKNANPVPLSATGVPPNIFFNGEAKAFLLRNNLTQIRVLDPVPGGTVATDAFANFSALITYAREDIVRGSDERYYISITNNNIDNDPVTPTGFWMEIRFINVWDTAYTFEIGYIALASDGNLYRSLTASNQGNDPVSSPSKWIVLTQSGAVIGPGSSTNNAVALFDLATGKLLKNSVVIVDGSGNMSGIGTLSGNKANISSPGNTDGNVNIQAPSNAVAIALTARASDDNAILSAFENDGTSAMGSMIFSPTEHRSFFEAGQAKTFFLNGTGEIMRLIAAGLSFDGGTNSINNYEEGTWTVGFRDASSNVSATTGTGEFQRTGNECHIEGRINNISTAGLNAGEVFFLTGLPFTANTETFNGGVFTENIAFVVDTVDCVLRIQPGTTEMKMSSTRSAAGSLDKIVSDVTSGTGDIKFEFNYLI